MAKNETVNELLHRAELALEQNADMEARVYLKMAMLRDENRAEPYYWLSELCEIAGEVREALHYYCRAIDAGPTFQPSRKALRPLKTIGDRDKWLRISAGVRISARSRDGKKQQRRLHPPMHAIHSEKLTASHDRLAKSLRS